MNELKNYICYKSEFKRILSCISGNYIYDNNKIISKLDVLYSAKLIASCIQKGEYISNSLPNCPEWWMVTLAAFLAGAIVIVYPNEKIIDEIISMNEKYGVKVAFFSKKEVHQLLIKIKKPRDCYTYDGGLVLFTSGTQHNPKGVLIEYYNYIPSLIATQNKLHMTNTDKTSCFAPYSHAMGFMYGLCNFCYGGNFYICKNQLELINLIIKCKVDTVCLQPIFLEDMLKVDSFTKSISSLKYVIIAGAPISKSAYDYYCNNGTKILNAYGMTECVAAIAITDSIMNDNNDCGSDIMDLIDIKISCEGEILVSGPTVCKKYINGKLIPDNDGWYHTHDIGKVQNNKLYIFGRMDNVIVCQNGYKISLESIEDKVLKISEIDACVAKYINKHLIIDIVSKSDKEELYILVDKQLEYFEKPFKIEKVRNIEVYNGKKRRTIK